MSPNGTTSLGRLHAFDLPAPSITPPRTALPVLLSIPHAGRDYPNWLLAAAWGGRASLEVLEDPLVDRLAWRAMAGGFATVIAHCPRAAIDCNRAEDELDPSVIEGLKPAEMGPRSRAGLGLVPARTSSHGQLWRRRIGPDELERRLQQVHRPYHDALERMLGEIAAGQQGAVLLDLHSMPPRPAAQPQHDIVIGDRNGTSAAPWVSALAASIARERGFSVVLNDPFAGGHIAARHGTPAAGIHALQIEVARTSYCQRDCRTPGPGFERVACLFEALASGLGEALGGAAAIAAE